jgi:tryptophan synthase beta chain
VKNAVVKPVAFSQREVFEAGVFFAGTQGIVLAPECAHALKAVKEIARKYVGKNENHVILFNFSGHGLLDLAGYSEYLNGGLQDA